MATAKKAKPKIELPKTNTHAMPKEKTPVDDGGPWTEKYEEQQALVIETPEPAVNEEPIKLDPKTDQVMEVPPMQKFESEMNFLFATTGTKIPLPLIVGFLDLKILELKESYRLQIEANLRRMMEEKANGNS